MLNYKNINNILIPTIKGAKSRGGGGSSHTPREAKDTGRSRQVVDIVEVISEGEIYGLVDDMKSIYLDKTPVANPDGTFNFQNVEFQGRVGIQDQDIMKGFSSVQREVPIGLEVKHNKPLTRRVTDKNVTSLRITVGVKALFQQENNGDTNGSTVSLNIKVGDRTYPHTFNGKYSQGSPYFEMIELEEIPAVPFNITVERVTPDSDSQRLQNGTVWASYTEIIDDGFAYPNTAVMGISLDSEYFSSIPQRNYLMRGLIIDVPDIYDPLTRQYSSDFWNGEFKKAWTNNPVWIWHDLVTNKRYGMGRSLAEFNVDKFQLFAIGKYCDELVPDGYGGTEPRMTCNVWITEQKQAYEIIQSLSSVFRAMPIWNGQALTAVQDRVADPVWTYTNANVADGLFTYSRSARKARHNTIQVEYVNPDDFYNTAIEQVTDDESIKKFGIIDHKVTAFGCTSRGQAYRTGRWILETEKLETETVSFTVGSEGLMHLPYDIIEVADNQFAGTNIGGRVLSANGTQVILDREIEFDDKTYLSYINRTGAIKRVKVLGFNKETNTATIDNIANDIEELAIWSLETAKVVSGLYRCIAITEDSESGTYSITALQHVPEKEDIVVNGTHFDPKPRTVHTTLSGVTVDYDGKKTVFKGEVAQGLDNTGTEELTYDIRVLKNNAVISNKLGLKQPNYSIDDLENGEYTVVITIKDSKNRVLSQRTQTFTIDKPPIVTEIEITTGLQDVRFSWKHIDFNTETEIWANTENNLQTAQFVARVKSAMYAHNIGAEQTRYYWLRHVRGINTGAFDQVTGRVATTAKDLNKQINDLNKNLSKNIVNEIIDVALPARKLGLTKYVSNLDVNVYQGQKQVYDETTNKTYNWNGTKYVPVEIDLSASKIKGLIQPNQLAPIPTTKLDGKLTDTQIQSLSATKLVGNINIAQIPSIPTNKLTGLLSDSQLQNISATKITGTLDISKVPAIPTSKLTGTVGANQISANSIGTNHLGANAVTAQKILSGAITSEKITSNAITADKIASNAITTTKLSANAITAQKIAANAIESNHIKAGAIVAGKLASNSVVADNIATNAITATKIMGGAITAEKLSANSVGANAIQAGAIGTDKLSVNAVDSGKIRAGAVTANHLRAGQISADKLAIGLGGNLFYNPIFANNGNGWTMYVDTNNIENNSWGFNRNTGRWDGHSYLDTENQFRWERSRKNTNDGNVRLGGLYQDIKLVKDKYYCFSAYVGGHRAFQDLDIENGSVEVIHKSWTGRGRQGGFEQVVTGTEEEYRIFMIFRATANNHTSYRFIIRQWANGRQNNPFVFIRRPMLEECTEYSRQPSGWVNAGVTSIHGGSIVTNSITADKIGANQITANHIAGETIAARHIATNSITGDKIVSRSITADKIVVQKISVISSDLGSITAGSLKIGSLNGNYGTMFEIQQNGGFRLISRDSTGGIELSSATRALHVWNGANEVVRVGKLS